MLQKLIARPRILFFLGTVIKLQQSTGEWLLELMSKLTAMDCCKINLLNQTLTTKNTINATEKIRKEKENILSYN
jgi:hypothetical protein